MTPGKNLQDKHLRNIDRGLTFEASGKEEESAVDKKAEEPKRDLVRERPLRTARPGRSRKRA